MQKGSDLDPHPSHSFAYGFSSATFKELRALIRRATVCSAQSVTDLPEILKKLETFIAEHSADYLLMLSEGNNTLLHDVLNFNERRITNPQDANWHRYAISETYLIVASAIRRRRPEYFLDLLCVQNDDGYAVLHRALKVGNVKVVREILSTLENNEDLLTNNLNTDSKRNLSCLHLTIRSENPELLKEMINYLAKDERCLQSNLISKENSGFTILHECVKNGSPIAVEQILTTLSEPKHQSTLEYNLSQTSVQHYNILHDAIIYQDITTLQRICDILKSRKSLLSKMLSTPTVNGMLPLHAAFQTGDVQKCFMILSLLREDAAVLQFNMQHRTNKQFSMLASAMLTKSAVLVKAVLELLDKKPAMLKYNLQYTAQMQESILIIVLERFNADMVELVLNYLRKFPEDYRENLKNSTAKMFSVLHKTCLMKDEKMFFLIYKHLHDAALLTSNLKVVSEIKWTALFCAIKSNHLTIVRKIVEELRKDPTEFKKQLATISADGYSIIHAALMAEDPAITLDILAILNEYPQILSRLLVAYTKDGYMTLQSALFSKSEVKVSSILSCLSQYPNLLTANLENVTSRKYGIIQTTLKTKDINIIRKVFAVLKDSPALRQNVMHKNEHGKMALYNALEFSDEEMVKEVFTLLRRVPGALRENVLPGDENLLVQALKTGNEKIVAMFFSEVEHDEELMLALLSKPGHKNHKPLLQALQAGNVACLTILICYLKKYRSAIEDNISNKNDFQYNCFQQAINSENLEVVNLFIKFCKEYYGSSQAYRKLKVQAKVPNKLTSSAWANTEFIEILETYFDRPYGFSKKNKRDIELALPAVKGKYVESWVKKLSMLSDKQYSQLIQYAKEIKDEFETNAIALVVYSNPENQNNIIHDVLDIARKKSHQDHLLRDMFSELLLNLYANLKFHFPVKMHDILLSRNAMGETLLESAISFGGFSFIKMLVNQYAINRTARSVVFNTERTSLLYLALQTTNPEVVEFIVSSLISQESLVANILYRDSVNNSCLHMAANSINTKIANKFLETVKSVFITENISILQALAVPHSNFTAKFWGSPEFNDLVIDYIRFNQELFLAPSENEDNINSSNSSMTISQVDDSDEQALAVENYFARAARLRREARANAAAEAEERTHYQATRAHGQIPMLYRIHGGIAQKYLGDILPNLPVPPKDPAQTSTESQSYERTHVFESLQRIAAEESQIQPLKLETSYFKLSYYTSNKPVRSSEHFTFVMSGRLASASVPTPANGRCVLVFTAQEYQHVKSHLPAHVDVLVVHALKHCLGASYSDLSGITERRLAVFYLAHYLKFNYVLMVDDNIKRVKFNSIRAENNSWDAFFLEMCSQAKEYGCVSVKTDSHKEITRGLLGSKLFCINMQKLRRLLPETYDISLLSPPPKAARKWGEDYYFQIMIHFLMNHKNQGYQIVPEEVACLDRMKSQINLAAARGIRATLFDEIDEIDQLFIEEQHIEKVHNTVEILNQIIAENYDFYERNRQYIENVDLLSLHAKANFLEWLPFVELAEHPNFEDDFIERLHSQIDQYLPLSGARDYQAAAINSVKDMNTRHGRFKLTTSSGKTYQQSILAILGYHAALPGQHIVIVVPHISLMIQFYRDLMKVNQKYIDDKSPLAVPNNAVITVSSHQQSCNIGALLLNRPVKAEKAILIVCEDSIANLFEIDCCYLQRIPMLLLDEYHLYPSFVAHLLEMAQAVNPQMLIVGSTATPPADDALKPTLYRYGMLEGIDNRVLAPVVADSLGINYSKTNVNVLMKCLPAILNSQYHPGFQGQARTLRELKGIVYLPKIEDCEKAAQWLTANGIRNYCIHSKNGKNKRDLQAFMDSNEPGVLLAVFMLRIGFSHNELAWGIIGQGADPLDKASRNKIKQMIGRVMRYMLNKYGYVLAFDDVVENIIKPYLAGQTFSIPFEQRYLQAKQSYIKQGSIFQAVTVNAFSNKRKDRIRIIPSVTAPLLQLSAPIASSSLSPEPLNVVASSTSTNAILTSYQATRMAAMNRARSIRIIHDPESDEEPSTTVVASSSSVHSEELRQSNKRAAQETDSTRRTRSRSVFN